MNMGWGGDGDRDGDGDGLGMGSVYAYTAWIVLAEFSNIEALTVGSTRDVLDLHMQTMVMSIPQYNRSWESQALSNLIVAASHMSI